MPLPGWPANSSSRDPAARTTATYGWSRRELLDEAALTVRCARLEAAIALVEPCRESPIESLAAGHFHLAGLPCPLFQEPVRTRLGVFFPDCYWPEHRLIGEADGAVKYADADAYVKEKEREQAFRDVGVEACHLVVVRGGRDRLATTTGGTLADQAEGRSG